LRRALEALFDIGGHILAKRFGSPVTEYKEIAQGLFERKILQKKEADSLRKMAGYRNRMVHFYHEISLEELQEICAHHLDDFDEDSFAPAAVEFAVKDLLPGSETTCAAMALPWQLAY
jgi:uncharacterized protein YutE (UPF0331/DUF86 family)